MSTSTTHPSRLRPGINRRASRREEIALACPHCGKRVRPTPGEIRAIRIRTRLSPESLAALLGITLQYLRMLETGQRTMGPALAARFYALTGTKPVSGFDGDD
jgi:hypothetical protein